MKLSVLTSSLALPGSPPVVNSALSSRNVRSATDVPELSDP